MSESEDRKQQVIETLLENASLTDGLGDKEAQGLLDWCVAQLHGFAPTPERTLDDYGQQLARQARTIARIVSHIEDGDSRDRIEQRLRQLTDDPAQQTDFLQFLDESRSMQDCIQALCRIATSP